MAFVRASSANAYKNTATEDTAGALATLAANSTYISAYNAGPQTPATGPAAVQVWAVEVGDALGEWDGSAFTVGETGVYRVSYGALLTGTATTTELALLPFFNGAQTASRLPEIRVDAGGTLAIYVSASKDIALAAAETLDFRHISNDATGNLSEMHLSITRVHTATF